MNSLSCSGRIGPEQARTLAKPDPKTTKAKPHEPKNAPGTITPMPDVMIKTSRGDMPAYLAAPTTPTAPWPAIIVLHDIVGMSTDLRHQSDWLANAGYLALAPNLLHRGR